MTGSPNGVRRERSPFALIIMVETCGASRAIAWVSNGFAGKRQERFIGASHTARSAAGENNATNGVGHLLVALFL